MRIIYNSHTRIILEVIMALDGEISMFMLRMIIWHKF